MDWRDGHFDYGQLLDLAREWWPSRGLTDAYDEVGRIVADRHDLVPDLIRALVETAPQGGDRYVGTSVIEDLFMSTDREGWAESPALDLLFAAHLDQGELFGVLSGVDTSLLAIVDARARLDGRLSIEQIDWLLSNDSPHRWASDGIMVADGATVRFWEGETEWMRLYGPNSSA